MHLEHDLIAEFEAFYQFTVNSQFEEINTILENSWKL